jgi:hypothetical protein
LNKCSVLEPTSILHSAQIIDRPVVTEFYSVGRKRSESFVTSRHCFLENKSDTSSTVALCNPCML